MIRWWIGYGWFLARHRWACFWRDLPWRIACWLPHRVALAAFVRVCGVAEWTLTDFEAIYKTYEARYLR